MISAYEHGGNAARHGKHIQACPFDSGTTQWREWRAGHSSKTLVQGLEVLQGLP
jgi:hypothetical protein